MSSSSETPPPGPFSSELYVHEAGQGRAPAVGDQLLGADVGQRHARHDRRQADEETARRVRSAGRRQMRGVRGRREHAAEGALRCSAARRAAAAVPGRLSVVRSQRADAHPAGGRAAAVRDGPAVVRQHRHAEVQQALQRGRGQSVRRPDHGVHLRQDPLLALAKQVSKGPGSRGWRNDCFFPPPPRSTRTRFTHRKFFGRK